MGGVVIGSKPLIHHIKADALVDRGGTISPFNAWLIMRGSVALPLRLKQQFSSSETVAQSLADDKRRLCHLSPPRQP
jgi:methionine-gamma-lyase